MDRLQSTDDHEAQRTYRSVELDAVFSDHRGNTLVGAVAAIVARIHLAGILAPLLLERDDAMGNVELEVAARRRIDNNHDRHALGVSLRDQPRTFIGI